MQANFGRNISGLPNLPGSNSSPCSVNSCSRRRVLDNFGRFVTMGNGTRVPHLVSRCRLILRSSNNGVRATMSVRHLASRLSLPYIVDSISEQSLDTFDAQGSMD